MAQVAQRRNAVKSPDSASTCVSGMSFEFERGEKREVAEDRDGRGQSESSDATTGTPILSREASEPAYDSFSRGSSTRSFSRKISSALERVRSTVDARRALGAISKVIQPDVELRTRPVGMLADPDCSESEFAYRDELTRVWNKDLEACDFKIEPVRVPVTDAYGRSLFFEPMPSDGNCGFRAISRGMLMEGRSVYALDVRRRLQRELIKNRDFYEQQARSNEAFRLQMQFVPLEALSEMVMRTGPNGFWLGSAWGAVEVLALARALRISIELFSYDRESGGLRSYEQFHNGGKIWVGLLFSGNHERGHFDLLMRSSTERT